MSKSKLRGFMLAGGSVVLVMAFIAAWKAGDDARGFAGEPEAESPPLPTSMPEPPGKPERMQSPTHDTYQPPTRPICAEAADLCSTARGMAAGLAAIGTSTLNEHLAPVPVVCPEDSAAAAVPLCAGAGGQTKLGFTALVYAKSVRFMDEAAFVAWVGARLSGNTQGDPPTVTLVTVGCELPTGGGPPSCDRLAAASLVLEWRDGEQAVLVLFLSRDLNMGPFGVMAAASLPVEGSVVAGGPARRLLPQWAVPNAGGDYYFEPAR